MKSFSEYLFVGGLVLALAGCSSESEGEKSQELTVASVNSLIVDSPYHDETYQMTCGTGTMSGCFVTDTCYSSSQSYSTRLVYSLEESEVKALLVTYENSRCAGDPRLHPTVWSQWNYELNEFDESTNQAEMTLDLVRYADGFLFDSNKPVEDVMYKSKVWVDNNGMSDRFCLSEGFIDPQRPLKFMDDVAAPLDPNVCAVQLN